MRLGLRSLLFGCHQFILHPIFVYRAWVALYGWPNFAETLAIIFHDWGHVSSRKMDDEYGEMHPARIWRAFEWLANKFRWWRWMRHQLISAGTISANHSRFWCQKIHAKPSKLCFADKAVFIYQPSWTWCLCAWLSGEGKEYLANKKFEAHGPDTLKRFYKNLRLWAFTYCGINLGAEIFVKPMLEGKERG